MRIDYLLEFSNSQTVTATAISDVVPLRATGLHPGATQNVGSPNQMWLVIQVDETATAAGAATVTFTLESDSDNALTTSPTVHYSTGAIPKASLVAKTTLAVVPLPYGEYEHFLAVRYTVATGPLTAGKFSAFLTDQPQFWRAYADAV